MAIEEKNIILPGGNTCTGCSGPIINRIMYNVLGKNVIQFGGGCGALAPRDIPIYTLHHSDVATGARQTSVRLEFSNFLSEYCFP